MTGCASNNTLTMTYRSDPPGATIYQAGDDQNLGRTPTVATYQLSPENIKEGHARLRGARAVWESGASVGVTHFEGEIPKGRAGGYTFVRPDEVAGREIDLRFARELQQQQRQDDRQQSSQHIPVQNGECVIACTPSHHSPNNNQWRCDPSVRCHGVVSSLAIIPYRRA